MSHNVVQMYPGLAAQRTAVTTSGWTTILTLPASRMVGGATYVLWFQCGLATAKIRVKRGSTVLTGSEGTHGSGFTLTDGAHGFSGQYCTVFTQPGTAEAIVIEGTGSGGASLAGSVINPTLSLMELTGLSSGTDYLYDEEDDSGAPVALSPRGHLDPTVHQNFATITLPAGTWFVYGNVTSQAPTSGTSPNHTFYIDDSAGDRFLTRRGTKFYVDADDQRTNSAFYVLVNSSSRVLTIKGYSDSTSLTEPQVRHHSSRLFALNLDSLDFHSGETPEPTSNGQGTALTTTTPVVMNGPIELEAGYTWLNFDMAIPTTNQVGYYPQVEAAETPDSFETIRGGFDDAIGQTFENVIRVTPEHTSVAREWQTVARRIVAVGPTPCAVDGVRYCYIRLPATQIWGAMNASASSPTMSSSGEQTTPTFVGDMNATTSLPTMSASGTVLEPDWNASMNAVVAGPVMEAAGTFAVRQYLGSMDAQPAGPVMSASGVFFIRPIDGNVAASTSTPTMEAEGTFTPAACTTHSYVPQGREPISVTQGLQHARNYPLVQPSEDIRYLLADAYLVYEDPYDYGEEETPFEAPFHIAFLFGPGCIPNAKPAYITAEVLREAELIIRDNEGRDVFISFDALDFRATTWSNRLKVYEWRNGVNVCRIAIHTKWHGVDSEPAARNYDVYLEPESAALDERIIRRMPKRIRSITIGEETLTGDLEFVAGYNTELNHLGRIEDRSGLDQITAGLINMPTSGGRAGHRVQLVMEPGLGEGQAPGCEEVEPYLTKINNIGPNAYGDFIIQTDPCFYLERPPANDSLSLSGSSLGPYDSSYTQPGVLVLHSDCVPCCQCDDFVQLKLGIDSIYYRWQEIATDVQSVRDIYVINRDRWNEAKACFESDFQRLVLQSNCTGYVGVGYAICTSALASGCSGPLEVNFNFLLNAVEGDRGTTDTEDDGTPQDDDDPTPPTDDDPGGPVGRGFTATDESPLVAGRELLIDPQFAIGSSAWVSEGYAARSERYARYQIGNSSFSGTNNLLLEPDFETLTGWNTSGFTELTDDGVQVGDDGGGIGRLWQTVETVAGMTYRLRLYVHSSSGTNRIRISDSAGIEMSVQEIDAGLDNEYVELSVTASDSGLRISIEAEVAAVDYIVLRQVYLQKWAGALSQTVGDLTVSGLYRLSATIWSISGDQCYLRLYDSAGEVLGELQLNYSGNRYETLSTNIVAYDETCTFKVEAEGGDHVVELLGVSMLQLLPVSAAEQGLVPASWSGLSQGSRSTLRHETGEVETEDSETAANALSAALIPNTAVKSEPNFREMLPYDLTGEFPNLKARWDTVDETETSRISFAIGPCNVIEGDSLTVTAQARLNGVLLDTITRTIALQTECPDLRELCEDE